MGVVVESVSALGSQVHYRQAISPGHLQGSFAGDDTDSHDFKVDARGKSRLNVFVENPCNQNATVAIYGMHSATATVGDVGVKQIGSSLTVNAATNGYQQSTTAFPYYLVRVSFGVAPTDEPALTVRVYMDLLAF